MNALPLADDAATQAAGAALARASQGHGLLFLEGELGAGKTTLSRGLIRALGHQGTVKSPTYTLVEPYELPGGRVMHYDLYRLGDPEELEYLGLRDHLDADTLTLIEWPVRGGALLPSPDLCLTLVIRGMQRELQWQAHTPHGAAMAAALAALAGQTPA
ncbi:MAG TPA: tRNA (adenosine(37)-N6)-threonylcarbamoyltransferase complex ATPase subunit type 1 TsaE [Hyphomicrobiales bacterium]|nr:tRNA (adenosine(37)-N6)-threonylcarbamoyltransferase complex ATPase subunit type 1 TsaE [Hyphomicrobiales bacterium]